MVRNVGYDTAQHRIAEARRSGARRLSLTGLELFELPELLGELTELEALDLSANQLVVLPEWLVHVAHLQKLRLFRTGLREVPEWLDQLTQLKSLDLSDNQLTLIPESLGDLTGLQRLELPNNQLKVLPESIGQLSQLQYLDLSGNQLSALPESLGQLTQLRSLGLSRNQLMVLPESLGQLTRIPTLDLSDNQLTTLPESLGQLTQLQTVVLVRNRLRGLPDSIGRLTQLHSLNLSCHHLTVLPESIGQLRQLKGLDLSGNQLTDLPPSFHKLDSLCSLKLDGNPLNPDLFAVYKEGLNAVKHYLREMAKGTKKRYEAKLLILGDGNEGKTCVSRALRGLEFREQETTHGVDVVQWKFAHPDHVSSREKDITLNIWDFEGQEISHQTHQFFLNSQSLYLLVFKCRDQFLLDRAEYWLDTIRARAPQAKVAIVISQCEGRMPLVPLDRIQAQYSDLLAKEWFFPVGCQDGSNILVLQTFIQRWAADLEFMGSSWPVSYEQAESELKAKAKKGSASITRKKMYAIFHKAGVSEVSYEDVAAAMARLGVITQFPDCPDLRDFVVLRPQWLTKAISKVMEDKQLSEDQGEIALHRMESMWEKDYPGMFATFHNCMKEFELCYDLEDYARSCLVPLRFGYLRPSIPWSDIAGMKVRRVEYKLNI